MNVLSIIPLAAAVFTLCLGLFVILRQSRRLLSQLFFAFCAALAVANFGAFALFQPLSASMARTWADQVLLGIIIAPALLLHITRILYDSPRRSRICAGYIGATVLVLAVYAGLVVDGVRRVNFSESITQWVTVGGPLAKLVVVYIVVAVSTVMYALHTTVRNSRGIRRTQARYLRLGIGLAYACGMHDFFGLAGFHAYPLTSIPLFPVGSAGTMTLAWIMSYAFFRYRLMDVDLAVSRSVANAAVLGVLATVAYGALLGAQKAYFGEVVLEFSLVVLGVLVTATFLFPRLLIKAEDTLEQSLFGEGRNYHEALLSLSRELPLLRDVNELAERVNSALTSPQGVCHSTIYLEEDKGRFKLVHVSGSREATDLPESFTGAEALPAWLASKRSPQVREEVVATAGPLSLASQACEVMECQAHELALPLVSRQEFLGFVLLGPKRDGGIFSREDLELLSILSGQLSIAVLNAKLNEALARTNEVLQRTDRLAAIGTMAAVLAHEIRNPLVAIRTFTQLLPERYEDQEFRNSFLDLTLSEVDRISSLVSELLTFARPASHERDRFDLNDAVRSVCTLLETQARKQGVALEVIVGSVLPRIMADEDQVKQVVVNIVLNAIQSCDEKGKVRVKTSVQAREGETFVRLDVRDNGCGIDEEQLDNVFKPFFTTRSDGTGLGMPIAHQIVSRHGGFIEVFSRPGQGTTFSVFLPENPSSLREMEEDGLSFVEASALHA
ncbi:MAG: ATP-binding protein [Candidatus Binatia bacterium]